MNASLGLTPPSRTPTGSWFILDTQYSTHIVIPTVDNVKVKWCATCARTLPKGPEDFFNEITFEGDEIFQRKLRELCSENSDIFSDQLAEKPASLKPFEINIPLELWENDENRTPVHPQSSTKDAAL